MKYAINSCPSTMSKTLPAFPQRKIWQACNRVNVMKEFETEEEEAFDYIQSCIENDNWHSMNRD